MAEVIEDHIHHHLAAPDWTQADRNEAAGELVDVVRANLK